jgi:NADH-quinone oxidoreductase subunit L
VHSGYELGILTYLVPFIPILPVAAAAVIGLFGAVRKRAPGDGAYLAVGAMAISCLIALAVAWKVFTSGSHGHFYVEKSFVWAKMGLIDFSMGFIVDPLCAAMAVMVTFVGLMIFIYSIGYMHGDPRYPRFFAYMALFGGAMLGVVVANNLMLLYVCWELVGLTSYLLIGFWFERPSAMRACKKAFVVTRLGDAGFFVGLMYLMSKCGTLQFSSLFPQIALLGPSVATTAAVLIFCGAVGKSAQFPLHVWLPDAMEGPTPVSALIHAATMVAAGVYLVARCFPIFHMGPTALHTVMWIGAITALFAATIAVAQNDIKRILAYSTCSQLGYMMLGLGAGGFTAGVFHLMTHAFFKALLFMGAGSVIHGTGTQNIWEMGGLRRRMPYTFWTFTAGTLALAGIFPLAGFWSKDEILLQAFLTSKAVWAMGLCGAFLTAFYMHRLMFVVFAGKPRKSEIHAHESPRVMTIPLMVLAFFAVTLGWIGTPFANLFHHEVNVSPYVVEPLREGAPLFGLAALSLVVALAGIGLAALLYWKPGVKPEVVKRVAPLAAGRAVLSNAYFMDAFYWNTIVRALFASTWFFSKVDKWVVDGFVNGVGYATLFISWVQRWIDVWIVDGLVNVIGEGTKLFGRAARRLQTGFIHNYLLIALLGVVLLLWFYVRG